MKELRQLVLILSAVGLANANATNLYGQEVTTALFFPTYGTLAGTTPAGAPYTVVAGPNNPDLTFFGSARFDIDFQENKIVVTIDDNGCCTTNASFNGLSFRLPNGTFDAAVLESTNVPSFGADRVYLNGPNELLVHLGGGLNLDPPNSTIVISVVPELPMSALLGAGLFTMALTRKIGRTGRSQSETS